MDKKSNNTERTIPIMSEEYKAGRTEGLIAGYSQGEEEGRLQMLGTLLQKGYITKEQAQEFGYDEDLF